MTMLGAFGKGAAGDEAESLNVSGRLVVVEDLVEVVDAHEELVGHARRDDTVVNDGDVLDVDRRFFVEGEEL